MAPLFKDRSPVSIIWLIILTITVHGHFFVDPPVVVAPVNDGLISRLLNQYVAGTDPVLVMLLYHFLVISQALRLNYLFNEQRMFSRATYLTAMAYVLLTAVFAQWNQLTPALVVNTLIIWLFSMLVRLYNNPNPKTLVYNVGLLIGACILLYHPTTLLILVAIFALIVVRPFSLTEWLVLLMGVVTPSYFLGMFLYLTNRWQQISTFVPGFQLHLPGVHTTPVFYITVGLIVLFLCIGVYHFQEQSRRMLIQARKNWGVLMAMLLVMLPLPFISQHAAFNSLLMWCIPATPFLAKSFLAPKRNTTPVIMFWIMVVLIAANNWVTFKI